MTDLTPENVEHFAAGTFPHERPTELDQYREQLRAKVLALPRIIGRNLEVVWVKQQDVVDLIDGAP